MDLLLDVRFSLAERTFEAVRTLVAQSSCITHHSSLIQPLISYARYLWALP